MYKRLIAVIIALFVALAITACGENSSKSVKLDEGTPVVKEADKAAEEAAVPEADNKDNKDAEKAVAEDKAEEAAEAEKDTQEEKDDKDDKAETEPETEPEELETVEGVVAPKERLTKEWTGIITADGDGLNLRSGPDSEYEEIDLIPDDTEVTIYAEEEGWGYTNYKDQYGWIFLEWVEKQL